MGDGNVADGGMPFMRNSTATSGLPFEARRQARTSASGKPMDVRLETTSVGNSEEWVGAGGAAVVVAAVVGAAGAGVAGVGAVVEDEVVVGAGVVAVAVGAGAGGADVVGGGGVETRGSGAAAGAGAGAAGLAAADFLAFVIIHTRKSLGLILQDSMATSSFNTFPEWMSFIFGAARSDFSFSIISFT